VAVRSTLHRTADLEEAELFNHFSDCLWDVFGRPSQVHHLHSYTSTVYREKVDLAEVAAIVGRFYLERVVAIHVEQIDYYLKLTDKSAEFDDLVVIGPVQYFELVLVTALFVVL